MAGDHRLVWIGGELVPESEAKISVFDIGRLYGATFYESIRTFRHKFFKRLGQPAVTFAKAFDRQRGGQEPQFRTAAIS